MSDVFGRKGVLLVCYVLFAVGNLLTYSHPTYFTIVMDIDLIQRGWP